MKGGGRWDPRAGGRRGLWGGCTPTSRIEKLGWIWGLEPRVLGGQGWRIPQQSPRPDHLWTVGPRVNRSGLLLHSQETPAWLLVPEHLCPKDLPAPQCEGSVWEWPRCMVPLVFTPCSEKSGRRQVWSQLHLRSCPTLFLQAARQHFMGRTVGACASVRTVPAVTTSAASAPAAQASPGNTASRVSCPDSCPWVLGPGLSLHRESFPLQGPPVPGSTPCSLDFWS